MSTTLRTEGDLALTTAPTTVTTVPAMDVRDVSVHIDAQPILSDVTLAFPERSITALVGPTGCGKTTMLRSLNRMNDRVRGMRLSGRIELFGEDIYAKGADPMLVRRRVGMLFQRPNPFPMSIVDNITAAVKAHGLAKRSELADVAERTLREVGLWDAVSNRLNSSPFRLSGGQQQLLCLARALAIQPEVLLLDEPTSALDPDTTQHVEDLLVGLAPSMTVIMVTHNLAQARRVSAQTAFFYAGKLVETGPTAQLFEHPAELQTSLYVQGRFG